MAMIGGFPSQAMDLPWLDAQSPAPDPMAPGWIQQGMPAIPQPTVADPQVALLNQIMSQPLAASNPMLARMMAYAQLQQANQPRGPFTGLVNPIVNALVARQLGPQIQQQQQQAALLQRMKVLEMVSKVQASQEKTGLTKEQRLALEGERKVGETLPPSAAVQEYLVKHKLIADPNAELAANTAAKQIEARQETAQANRISRETIAREGWDKAMARVNAAQDRADNRAYAVAVNRATLEEYKANARATGRQESQEFKLKLADLTEQYNRSRDEAHQDLQAQHYNIMTTLAEKNLDFNQQREARIAATNYLQGELAFVNTMDDKTEKNSYLMQNLAPVMERLMPGVPFTRLKPESVMEHAQRWISSFGANAYPQATEPAPGSGQPIPQQPSAVGTMNRVVPRYQQQPLPSQVIQPSTSTVPPVQGIIRPGQQWTPPPGDPGARPLTPQERRLGTPTGQSYSNVPPDMQNQPPALAPPAAAPQEMTAPPMMLPDGTPNPAYADWAILHAGQP